MKKNLRLVILACALAGSPLAFAQSSSTASSPGGRMDQGSQQMHQSLKVGMQKMHGHMTGDTDQDFATMMRMHHQHGVEMAKAEVQNGRSPELKAMAQKIIEAQQKEISQLDAWLAKHK
jgi:uncharacterized protein (DUF305 family)